MTSKYTQSARSSFSNVPETCPQVDAKLKNFFRDWDVSPAMENDIRSIVEFAKEKNNILREHSIYLGELLLDAGGELP